MKKHGQTPRQTDRQTDTRQTDSNASPTKVREAKTSCVKECNLHLTQEFKMQEQVIKYSFNDAVAHPAPLISQMQQ